MDDIQNSTGTPTSDVTENTGSVEITPEQQQTPLEYQKGVSLSEKIGQNPDALQQILDLDKVEKFRWNGREYTRDALKKEIMFHKDYTQKTQKIAEERKAFEERKKFDDNLYADIEKVKANPALAEEFKKTYPEFYHKLVDYLVPQGTIEKEAIATTDKKGQQEFKDPRVDEVYQYVNEQKQRTAEVEVNALFDKLSTKYPDASEREVIGQVQHLLALHKQSPQEFKKPDDKTIEDLFSKSQEERINFAKSYGSKNFKAQKQANVKGAGPGAGGGVPGTAPKVARTIKEATALAMQDPAFQ